MQERNAGYWQSIVEQVRSSLEKRAADIGAVLHIPKGQLEFRFTVSLGRLSPRVSLDSTGMIATVDFPEAYFRNVDKAVQWMATSKPFRDRFLLARHAPDVDYSMRIHRLWSEWILQHEIAHVICGHLKLLGTSAFTEFAVHVEAPSTERNELRVALEFDADYLAARLFFSMLGGVTLANDWYIFFGLGERAEVDPAMALHDVGMLFVPLFIEMDRIAKDNDPLHPPVFERILCFYTAGLKGYADRVGVDFANGHWEAVWDGVHDGLVAASMHLDELANRPRAEPDLDRYRQILLRNDLKRYRLIKLRDDWLDIAVSKKIVIKKRTSTRKRDTRRRKE